MNFGKKERLPGRPKLKEKDKKSTIYSERMIITLTPEQKIGIELLSRQAENSINGYIRHLINEQIKISGL